MRRTPLIVTAVSMVLVGPVASSDATFKGRNGLIAYTTGNGDEEAFVLRTVRPDGSRDRALIRPFKGSSGGASQPKWSADGRRLLFGGGRVGTDRSSLWHATARGKRIRRIPLGFRRRVALTGWDWAPSGRRVVFSASGRLYTIGLDGSRRRSLHLRGYDPVWSPDGSRIVFERAPGGRISGRTVASEIVAVRPNGKGLRRLASESRRDSSPDFTPDGRRINYIRYKSNRPGPEWRRVDITGRNDSLLTSFEPPPPVVYCEARSSPDGQQVGAVRVQQFDTGRSRAQFLLGAEGGSDDQRVAFTFPRSAPPFHMCSFSWQAL